ncbi:MAG TPA: dienelactone hydrolase family protein [Polyangiaceae bacterium]|nr:dienelactone hydrolase family protein [Polyangiaceae bacterium]
MIRRLHSIWLPVVTAVFAACSSGQDGTPGSNAGLGTAGGAGAGAGGTPIAASGGAPVVGAGGAPVGQGGAVGTGGTAITASGGTAPIGNGGSPIATGGAVSGGAGGTGAGGSSVSTGGVGGASGAAGAAGTAGAAGAGAGGSSNDCSSLPPVTDYTMPGPFADAKMFTSVGPNNNYTLYRPDASLGKNGFIHPIATWGNGILTTPDQYNKTLSLIASHGFVIIACNDTMAERPCLNAGMDWLVQQNTADGPMKGKLDVNKEVAIGYSWGGGAAIDVSDRPNIKATVSLHGMPPRVSNAFDLLHAPLLLFTSTGDMFVTASQYVTPNYQKSMVQTFYATLNDSMAGHLYPVDVGASICIGAILGATFGSCGGDIQEHAPTIAWLRYWTCGDQGAKKFFFGSDCTLCGQSPWNAEQRKPDASWQ